MSSFAVGMTSLEGLKEGMDVEFRDAKSGVEMVQEISTQIPQKIDGARSSQDWKWA
jgi:hypothetical protein